jgi:hypothetical protein
MQLPPKAQISIDKSTSVYKLIHVGLPSTDHSLGIYTIPCYFQPWSAEQNCALSSNVTTRIINSCLAGDLNCGSLWSTWQTKITESPCRNAESHIFQISNNPVLLNNLQDIINPATLTPSSFWAGQGRTPVIYLECNGKNIIIPYFELVRALFYNASQRLTRFFFSQLSLESLCRPFDAPSIENSFLARFCVASTDLSMLEAQVLAGLLFEPSMYRTLNFAQSYWRSFLIPNPPKASKSKSTNIGTINCDAIFNANGYSFTHEEKLYFWVNTLNIINSPYNFEQVIFHPVTGKKHNFPQLNHLPLCSNLLQTRAPKARLIELWNKDLTTHSIVKHPLHTTRSKRDERGITGVNALQPCVECGLPWAQLPAGKNNSYELTDPTVSTFLSTEGISQSHAGIINPRFKKLLNKFSSAGYHVSFLELNNSKRLFGKSISVFPVENQPPLPAAVHKKLIKPFILAEIQLNNGSIFLAQPFYKECPNMVVFFQKQNLTKPDTRNWNKIMNVIPFVHSVHDFHNFYRKVTVSNKQSTSNSEALIALPIPLIRDAFEICLKAATHIVNKFRKRLQFVTACMQRYPEGMSKGQFQKVRKLSSNICSVPDANFVSRLEAIWLI